MCSPHLKSHLPSAQPLSCSTGAPGSRNSKAADLQDLPLVRALAAVPAPWVWFYRQRWLPCRKAAAARYFETKLKKGISRVLKSSHQSELNAREFASTQVLHVLTPGNLSNLDKVRKTQQSLCDDRMTSALV